MPRKRGRKQPDEPPDPGRPGRNPAPSIRADTDVERSEYEFKLLNTDVADPDDTGLPRPGQNPPPPVQL
jgi:hypothetical protein